MWFTWKERCNRSFEDNAKTPLKLASEIQRQIYFVSRKKVIPNKKKKKKRQPRRHLLPFSWLPKEIP